MTRAERVKHLHALLKSDDSFLSRCERLIPQPSQKVGTASEIVRAVSPLLLGFEEERSALITMDSSDILIDVTLLGQGSHRLVTMDVPHILRMVLTSRRPAAGFALAHTHPDAYRRGPAQKPSPDDVKLTRRVRDGARAIGVDLADHVILFPDGTWFSFQDSMGLEFLDGGKSAKALR